MTRQQHARPAADAAHRRLASPRLGAARQATLWGVVLLLVATGMLWLWAEYLYLPADDGVEGYEIKHYAMTTHAAFALVFVFIAGTLLYTHMQAAWQQGRNRATGLVIAGTALLLTLSGYGLWYFGGDALRNAAELVHWGTGFAIPLVLLAHALLGRRRNR